MSDPSLEQILAEVDIVPLALSLVQLTGEVGLLAQIAPYIRGPWDYTQKVPEELSRRIRRDMLDALGAQDAGGTHGKRRARERPRMDEPYAAGATASGAVLSDQDLLRMCSVAVGGEVAAEYLPLIKEQMQIEGAPQLAGGWRLPERAATGRNAVIVGAGVAGLCAAIHFQSAGISYVVIEKNADLGGTWWENRYPGCAVDTPNHFYQFSFEPNNAWSHYFSRREANLNYLRRCAEKYDVTSHIRFNAEVSSANFDASSNTWTVTARAPDGTETRYDARYLVCAVGQLNRPAKPDIPGYREFVGPIVHTAEWQDTTVRAKRIGLIGTAASGVQLACAIADQVASLSVFQRSGNWIVRNPNIHRQVSDSKKWALDHIPFYAAWYRFQLFWGYADGLFPALQMDPEWPGGGESVNKVNARLREGMVRHIRAELEGREDLIAKVIPSFPPFGKRVLGDPGWFKMLRRPNVELVTDAIERIEPKGIRTADGTLRELDVIVLATGFQAGRMLWPMDIRGRDGFSIREAWGDDDPKAHLGVTVPRFPNMFVLYGPNTATGHGGSFTFLAECQVAFMMGCIRLAAQSGSAFIEPRADVTERYNREIDERLKGFVWSHPSVKVWYKNAAGRITTNQPWKLIEYWNMTRGPRPEDYVLG
jgi:4-hydroxyacetophenone monooxygenase